jgi:hypothetical protein
MKRSLYPSGVEVGQEDLGRTEDARSEEILARASDGHRVIRDGVVVYTGGIAYGLRLSVNGVFNTQYDVSAGRAYAANGERIEVAVAQQGLLLADYTNGNKNLIVAFYKETQTTPQPHISDGTTSNTAAEPDFEIVAMTQAQYDATPSTFPTDLTQRARDRSVIIGTILGNGIGGAIQTGEIVQEAIPTDDHTRAQYTTTAFSGINIVSCNLATAVDPTPAALRLQIIDDVTKNLYFRASTTFGASVNIAALNGTTILTATDGSTLTVEVSASLIPRDVSDTTLNLTIERLYDRPGTLWSAADLIHRAKAGGSAPTHTNPHGLSLQDLAQSFLKFLGGADIGRGGISSLLTAALPRLVMAVSGTGGVKTNLFESEPAGGGKRLRVYIDGTNKTLEITFNARWDGATSDYKPDVVGVSEWCSRITYGASDYMITLQSEQVTLLSGFSFNNHLARIDLKADTLRVTKPIELGRDVAGSDAQFNLPRIKFFSPDPAVAGGFRRMELFEIPAFSPIWAGYRVYYDIQGGFLEFTYNCSWDNTALQYVSDRTGFAYSLAIGRVNPEGGMRLVRHNAVSAGATWLDGGWDSTLLQFLETPNNITEGHILNDANNAIGDVARVAIRSKTGPNRSFIGMLPFTDAGGDASEIRLYRAILSSAAGATRSTELTINAKWDATSSQWAADNIALPATKIDFCNASWTVSKQTSTGSPWLDSAWLSSLSLDSTTSNLEIQGNFDCDDVIIDNKTLYHQAPLTAAATNGALPYGGLGGPIGSDVIPLGSGEEMAVNLRVPDGATITAVTLFYSVTAAVTFTFTLRRWIPSSASFGTDVVAPAFVSPVGAGTFSATFTIANPVIDNFTYSYRAQVEGVGAAGVTVNGIRISYVINTITGA